VHTPTSDVDVKGVCVPPSQYVLGIDTFEQADKPEHFTRFLDLLTNEERAVIKETKLEGSIYECRKFVRLAADANPNILDVLFCRDEDVLLSTKEGRTLRENRDAFLSAKAKHTFSGYAIAQLKRIKTHRRWLLSPPSHKPTRAEHNLPESTLIPADQLAAAEALVQKKLDSWEIDLSTVPDESDRIAIMNQFRETLTEIAAGDDEKWRAAVRMVGIDDNLMLIMDRERKYKAAKTEWDNYQSWKKSRNPSRAALEEKYGYDCKHGAHLVRLMRMCREIIEKGEVNVWRGNIDADEIRAIRNGAWSYDKLMEYADAEDQALSALYDAKRYVVPHTPNRARINALCVELMSSALR
jgi:uncharacterized protein